MVFLCLPHLFGSVSIFVLFLHFSLSHLCSSWHFLFHFIHAFALWPLSQKAPFWLAALFATKINFNTCPWLAPLKIHYSLSSPYMPAQFYHFRNIHGLFKEKLHTVLALSVIGKMERHSQDFNEFCNIADIFAPERQTLSASFLCQSS